MNRWLSSIVAICLACGALAARAADSPLDTPATTTAPQGEIFGELFPSSVNNPYGSTSGKDPFPNLFDPLLAAMLRHDNRRGQMVGFESEVAGRLIDSAPPTSAPVINASPDGSLLEPQVAAAPPPLRQATVAVEGSSPIPLVLIGTGVLILMILGIIQLYGWSRKNN